MEFFEFLPDAVVLLILNDIKDVKSLGACAAVSRRFRQLVPCVTEVVVRIDCIVSEDASDMEARQRGVVSRMLHCLGNLIRPLQTWLRADEQRPAPSEVAHHSPGEVIKQFSELRHLRIELPGGELGIDKGALLKWCATFGSTLESCVVIGATSLPHPAPHAAAGGKPQRSQLPPALPPLFLAESPPPADSPLNSPEWHTGTSGSLLERSQAPLASADRQAARAKQHSVLDTPRGPLTGGSVLEPRDTMASASDGAERFTCDDLKVRIAWTISSLIAAAARHYLLKQIIAEHPTLESLVLADADGQGTLIMGKAQNICHQNAGVEICRIPSPCRSDSCLLAACWPLGHLIQSARRERPMRASCFSQCVATSLPACVCVLHQQLAEYRRNSPKQASSSPRTSLPDMLMSLWYAAELPSEAGVLAGATLLSITRKPPPPLSPTTTMTTTIGQPSPLPDSAPGSSSSPSPKPSPHPADVVTGLLRFVEEPLRSAAEYLLPRRTHCLEMNAF
eukprot:jgi/Mesen1/10811/ME000093S10325